MAEPVPAEAPGWYLVLMIWGKRYPDAMCDRLIRSVLRHSRNCAGIVVLTERTGRDIDPRARQVEIPPDFNRPEFRMHGLVVKIGMFDIPEIPRDATCIYLDLDTLVVGNLDRLAPLAGRTPIWTIPVFPRPFSALYRLLWRVTKGRVYASGNSSVFVYRNGFEGNPAQVFRRLHAAGTLPRALYRDDSFIAWSCQDRIRGLSVNDVVNFRFEFLAPTQWLSDVFAVLRARARSRIAIVTFAGPETKPERLATLPDGAVVRDHRGRVGRWTDRQTGGMKSRILQELE